MSFAPRASLTQPAANLAREEVPNFYAGRALSRQPWLRAPSITDARDGLGPLYNARSCLACHVEGGRGVAAQGDGPLAMATLVRLSLPGRDDVRGVVPEPSYGAQLQPQSIALSHQLRYVPGAEVIPTGIAPEGIATVTWELRDYTYPDGETVELRRPRVSFTKLAYGALDPETQVGLRHAPALHGLGLVDLIPERDIEQLADTDDQNGDGISGRPNRVWDPEREATRLGRFGLKANQATLRAQVAAALHGDMGLTTSLFPALPCTARQEGCMRAPHGAANRGPEVPDKLLDVITDFNRSIGVPKRRKPEHPMVTRGRTLFHQSGCPSCHSPRFVTENDPRYPHLSSQEIWPYSDFLLHDMGEGLADGRTDFLASGSEWRTSPLWGVGLARAIDRNTGLLHDGRARNVEEAVLWHDGEARKSRERFSRLSAADRAALLAFVRSL